MKEYFDIFINIVQLAITGAIGYFAYALQKELVKINVNNSHTFIMNCLTSQISVFATRNSSIADRLRNLSGQYRELLKKPSGFDNVYKCSLENQIEVFFIRFILNCDSQNHILDGLKKQCEIDNSKYKEISDATEKIKKEIDLSRITLAHEMYDFARIANSEALKNLATKGKNPRLTIENIDDFSDIFRTITEK